MEQLLIDCMFYIERHCSNDL